MKTNIYKLAPLIFISFLLSACSGPKISDYAKEKPTLELSEYFSGTIDAYGIFTDRSGEVVKRFTVLIEAKWSIVDGKKVGVLDESFEYSDGSKQKRIWRLTEVSPGRYIGKADDVHTHQSNSRSHAVAILCQGGKVSVAMNMHIL